MLRAFDPAALARSLAPFQRHLAYMSIWAIVFAVMSAAQGVGDSHRGQWRPFWRQACEDGAVPLSLPCRCAGDLLRSGIRLGVQRSGCAKNTENRKTHVSHSDLFEASGCVLVQQAGDQRLIRQTLCERPLLDRLQVLARQPDVQPAILRNVALA